MNNSQHSQTTEFILHLTVNLGQNGESKLWYREMTENFPVYSRYPKIPPSPAQLFSLFPLAALDSHDAVSGMSTIWWRRQV